ncbi:putative disease resistance protein RGA3 [Magnolia sinica]|uniref:putative disease resistance protein RGA3 n=1 Tax=Magnolia sinica TaxID=86752 RepID=UPI002659EC28|nr:putative disease resistance protein RGA3 [Magnolia sinica]
MVDAIVSTALQKLPSILQNELSLLTGLQGELEKLSATFATIQAMLEDAESRRVNERSVTIWLEKLKDLACYIDDILDEWGTEAFIPKDSEDDDSGSLFGKKKVSNFLFLPFSCFSHSVLRHRIGNRIKDVRERLDEIAKEASQLHLRVDSGERERADIKVRQHETRERETSSQVDDSAIIGREHEKNEIIELLLRESSQEGNGVTVISIIGMGGLGKMTLAQLAYNDEKEHFDMRMWVCISEDFDVKRITESVLKSAIGTGCESLDLDQLQCHLRELLQGKRFLLVLDDIWNEDSEKWDKLRLPFQNGGRGSRVIITTRSENVSSAIGNTQMHKLQVLSNDDCWLLFSQRALTDRSINECLELEKIGRKIVKKCGGVPLAAKTIGSTMRSKRTRRE